MHSLLLKMIKLRFGNASNNVVERTEVTILRSTLKYEEPVTSGGLDPSRVESMCI